jgi:DNA N-6-adenine-methyltransferase (Dam)
VNKSVLFSHTTDRWQTPSAVKEALYAEFALNFDPCPLDGTEDGLATLFCRWHGKRVFCNPPYGPGVGDWLRRGFEAEIAVYLLPARTDTAWFHRLCLPYAQEIRFLKGRLKFGDSVNSAPFPSMVVIFDPGQKQGRLL